MYKLKPFKHSSHDKIISLVKPNSKVLDVGCASGYIAYLLKNKNCQVTGIDIDEKYLEEAKNHCESVHLLDISKMSKEGKKIKGIFDVIILGDILEHTSHPHEILINLKENLKDEGIMIISVPNIVNLYARIKIISGNFDYEDKGIFDRTHLRFFTIKSLKKLVNKCGFEIKRIDFTPIPIKLIFKESPDVMNSSLHLLANIHPNLFAYQIIATIKKIKVN